MKKNIILYLKQRNIQLFCAAFFLLIIVGYIFGFLIGKNTILRLYSLKGSVVSFIFTPASNYYKSSILINSRNELERISGYYSLIDSFVLPEAAYLHECYLKEDSISAKKVLLWVFTRIENNQTSLDVLNSLYESADQDEKANIRKTIELLNKTSQP